MSAMKDPRDGDAPPASFQRVREVFEATLERLPEEREDFLEKSSGGDELLRREVQRMLAQVSSSGFIDQPAWEGFVELLDGDAELAIGSQLGPYRLENVLGAGGMGRVYRATDTRLPRFVALKVSRLEFSRHFEREARLVAALNHPNICSLYDVGPNYLVMELVAGPTLADRIKAGPLSCREALRIARRVAEALEAAHEKGIRHGDLKPANIVLGESGLVKVLDFGLATLISEKPQAAGVSIRDSSTQRGAVAGTAAYVSPEQAEDQPVDARSDLFSFGVVLYEMLCGRRPFRGENTRDTLDAIAHAIPEEPRRIRREIPRGLERVLLRCLEKKPQDRHASASEVRRDLESLEARLASRGSNVRIAAKAAAVTLLIGAAAFGIRSIVLTSRARWAEREAKPEIVRLMEHDRLIAALRLYRQAEAYSLGSRGLFSLSEALYVTPVSIETTPPGARVYVSDYADMQNSPAALGEFLGLSPLRTDRIPHRGYYRVTALKEGFEPIERAFSPGGPPVRLIFHSTGATPAGMVWIPGSPGGYPSPAPAVKLADYWLDRYEVSNRQFKEFVDAGGYQRRRFWKMPFVKNGHELTWDRTIREFHDSTGRPGPATWEQGTFPEGKGDFPVAGVSWYEAAAYAEFAGKTLPTVYHWYRAAGAGFFSDILGLSNFSGKGPAPIGKNRGLAAFGTYDMAGNLKEWCVNPAGQRRYILGGAWNEASSQFIYPDARDPFDREATFGFRTAKYTVLPADSLSGPVEFVNRDRRKDKPADERAFEIYKDLHSYDKTELDAVVQSADDSSPSFRRETVTFRAAYGDERMKAHLYLPKNATPPYQIVVFYGDGNMAATRSIRDLKGPFEFIILSGRALIIPAYKGTLERGPAPESRETMLAWSKDLGRSIDYLETRKDIDTRKLAFYGLSEGAVHGVRLLAVEPRVRTAVLVSGGSTYKRAAEVDPWNFAPRVKIPVLMLNGRDDFTFPLETNSIPLFRALGSHEKRQVLFDGGHVNLLTRMDLIQDIGDWLDQYLGPVSRR
jgi:eukaryotic-like serine/threonine-protein kinase